MSELEPTTSTCAYIMKKSTSADQNESEVERPATVAREVQQQSIQKAFKTIRDYEVGGSKYNKITNALICCICKYTLPLSTVEGIGFKKFVQELSPCYKIPTRNTIKDRI